MDGAGLFLQNLDMQILISLAVALVESLEYLERPESLVTLEVGYSFSSVFPFPSALSCASFPVPSDAFRIDSLL